MCSLLADGHLVWDLQSRETHHKVAVGGLRMSFMFPFEDFEDPARQ